jgi:hypothetical protein
VVAVSTGDVISHIKRLLAGFALNWRLRLFGSQRGDACRTGSGSGVGWIDVGEVHTAETFLVEKFLILPTAST